MPDNQEADVSYNNIESDQDKIPSLNLPVRKNVDKNKLPSLNLPSRENKVLPDQDQVANIQTDPKQKIRESIVEDRKRTSGFMDIMIPDYVTTGINAMKTLNSIYTGVVGGVESIMKFGTEATLDMTGPLSMQAASALAGGGLHKINPLPDNKRLEVKKALNKDISDKLDVIKPSLKLEDKFDLSNGFGIEDVKALPEIAGRMGFDMALGTSTGGVTYFMQGYSDAVNEYDDNIEKGNHEYSANARSFYGTTNGLVNSVLESYAIDKIFTGPAFSKIKSKILSDVLKETSSLEGRISINTIESLVKKRTTDALSTIKNRGIKSLYATSVESMTEGVQQGLGDLSKLATNAIQGKEVFDEKQVKDNFLWNIANASVIGGIMGAPLGAIAAFSKNTDNHILQEIAKAKTPEEVNKVIDNLNSVLDEQNASQEEKDLIIKRAQRYSEIKRTIPPTASYQVQDKAIRLIDHRNSLDAHIQESENQFSELDEALKPNAQESIDVFKDAKNSINDKIQDLVSGTETKYFKTDENYYRQVPGKSPERISKNRFDLEEIHKENNIKDKDIKSIITLDNINEKSTEELEKRQLEIEGSKPGTAEYLEFNNIDDILSVREWRSIFDISLDKVSSAIDNLIKKEKQMPNGFGSYIEMKDAKLSKDVANRYSKENIKSLSDIDITKDFSDAMLGNPDTWYADGLKLRESMNEANKRGIDIISDLTKEFIDDGYTKADAIDMVKRKLDVLVEKNNTQEAKLKEGKTLLEFDQVGEYGQPVDTKKQLIEPTSEQIQDDIDNGRFRTLIYNSESDIPEVFKDKITSRGENTLEDGTVEKFVKVTVPESLADYELSKSGNESKANETDTLDNTADNTGKEPATVTDNADMPNVKDTKNIMVGDKIQWSPNGDPKFDTPKSITSLDIENGTLKVEGSDDSIPMTEVDVIDPIIKDTTSVPTEAVSGIKRFLLKQLSPFGLLGRTITGLKERISGFVSAEMKYGEKNTKRVLSLIKKYNGTISEEDIDAYLSGKPSKKTIPADLASELTKLRNHIDGLTESLIESGVITDKDEIAKFRDNKGSYLTRAYELSDHTEVNIDNIISKLKNVDQRILDNALNHLAREIKIGATAAGETITNEEALNRAQVMANRILADQPNPFTGKKIEGSLNSKSLTERQNIDAPIRALMGEYTDPIHKYLITVFKLSTLISSQKYMNSLREVGMGKFLFKHDDPNIPKSATTQIASDGSTSMAPLNGLYTFPELVVAIQGAEKDKTGWLSKIAGIVRGFKTVYNPSTHVVNITGNIGFLVSNGHWNEASDAFELVRELITGKDTDRLNDLIFRLNKHGVLNNTIGVGELRAYFDKHASLDALLNNISNDKKKLSVKNVSSIAITKVKNVSKSIQDIYQMEDDIFKIIAYVNESNRYAKALFSKKHSDLDDTRKNAIDVLVSENIKNTYPSWSRVPAGIKNLGKYFVLGNFLSFPSESVRCSYETMKLANNEINSGNNELKKIGYNRIAGTIAYNSVLSAISMAGAGAAMTGATGLIGFFADDDKERERDKYRRMYMATWNKNKDVYVKQFKDGRLIYVDMGSSDPYGYQKEVFNTFWNHKSDGDGFMRSMASSIATAIKPLIDVEMTKKTLMNLYYNEDNYGKAIVRESDGILTKASKVMGYLNKSIAPGVVTTASKLVDSYNTDKDKFKAEVGALTGYRVYNVDLAQQFSIILNSKNSSVIDPSGSFKERIGNDYIKSWNTMKRSNATVEEKDAEYHRLATGLKGVIGELSNFYKGALEGGVPKHKLDLILVNSRLPKGNILAVVSGRSGLSDAYYLKK